jgi:excisionase family DNA binding protein
MRRTNGYREERKAAQKAHGELVSRLKELFHQRGWSCVQPAVLMGVPLGTFTQWMDGSMPNEVNRLRLAAFAQHLFDGTPAFAVRTNEPASQPWSESEVTRAVVMRLADAIAAWRGVAKEVAAVRHDVQAMRDLFISGAARVTMTTEHRADARSTGPSSHNRTLPVSSGEPFLTMGEAARRMRVNVVTLSRAIHSGHLKVERMGRKMLLTESGLRSWRAAGGLTAPIADSVSRLSDHESLPCLSGKELS